MRNEEMKQLKEKEKGEAATKKYQNGLLRLQHFSYILSKYSKEIHTHRNIIRSISLVRNITNLICFTGEMKQWLNEKYSKTIDGVHSYYYHKFLMLKSYIHVFDIFTPIYLPNYVLILYYSPLKRMRLLKKHWPIMLKTIKK